MRSPNPLRAQSASTHEKGLDLFYLIHLATAGTFPRGWAFLVFAAPGFLFLVSWQRSRGAGTAAT
jgi:hypothetical protein